jgi:hypothetical protein
MLPLTDFISTLVATWCRHRADVVKTVTNEIERKEDLGSAVTDDPAADVAMEDDIDALLRTHCSSISCRSTTATHPYRRLPMIRPHRNQLLSTLRLPQRR